MRYGQAVAIHFHLYVLSTTAHSSMVARIPA